MIVFLVQHLERLTHSLTVLFQKVTTARANIYLLVADPVEEKQNECFLEYSERLYLHGCHPVFQHFVENCTHVR